MVVTGTDRIDGIPLLAGLGPALTTLGIGELGASSVAPTTKDYTLFPSSAVCSVDGLLPISPIGSSFPIFSAARCRFCGPGTGSFSTPREFCSRAWSS